MLEWYHAQEILPWQMTRDPYLVWLSEIMLQQTTIPVIRKRYGQWLEEFPTIEILAEAELTQVLRAFEGLGYYARARHLHQTALYVHQFGWPKSYKQLCKLPGLGDYTTKTILSRCFSQPVLAFDVNVYRFFGRIFMQYPFTKKYEEELENVMKDFMLKNDPAIAGQTFMRFAQGHCKKREPNCQSCIFSDVCLARKHGAQSSIFPQTKKKRVQRESIVLVLRFEGQVLVEKRTDGVGKGMYSLPRLSQQEFEVFSTKVNGTFTPLKSRVHTYTHHVEKLFPHFLELEKMYDGNLNTECSLYEMEKLDDLPFMAIYRDILREIGSNGGASYG